MDLLVAGSPIYTFIPLAGTTLFSWIIYRRLLPLLHAAPDVRFDQPGRRFAAVLRYWLAQRRHLRFRSAGIMHIAIFAGFLILAPRAFSLLIGAANPALSSDFGLGYAVVRDYAATVVFAAMVAAVARRIVFQPARYGHARDPDAIFLLGLIALLMFSDALYDASAEHSLPPWALAWFLQKGFHPASVTLHNASLFVHELTFFFLLCYRPFGIQFHVETSLFSIYFSKLDKARLKPVRWDVPEDQLDGLRSLGVKHLEDFTWKHILDFYSCADCGRCSDQCPAAGVGRPLSPRLLTTKARDHAFRSYPVFGQSAKQTTLIGPVLTEDEIWSCTTCGACEAECPLLIEYIDKIVDLRRGLVDSGQVPQSLQKPLKALATRGNPWGKLQKKRADWANGSVELLDGTVRAEMLYFVDSISSYDDRIQSIARATESMLRRAGEDFGILGPAEKDSGHDVRRFGEESLFLALRNQNTAAIQSSGAQRIVVNDPHAYNCLKHDYRDLPPVEHVSQALARYLDAGRLAVIPVDDSDIVYTYHDPCYLGRHNGVYEAPRRVLDAIPGLKRVEMPRCRDRSFCCGGGGLAMFYEPNEEERMGVRRVHMAAEAGANVIVTACPFCMVNIEDAIKASGMEGTMSVIDLTELIEKQSAGVSKVHQETTAIS